MTLRQLLESGGAAFGVTLTIPDPFVAEVFAAQSFDFLLVDTEHSAIAAGQLQNQLIGLRCASGAALVRVGHNAPSAIMQALDLGAEGVVVPHVETAAEGAVAVGSAYYPPLGTRGVGPRRAGRLLPPGSYLATANERTMLIAMLETERGVANAAEIVRVDGLGGVIVGAADLAASLGHLGDPGHRDVVAAIDEIFAACAAADVPFGMFAADAEQVAELLGRGARIITVGSDLLFMERGSAAVHQQLRPFTHRPEKVAGA
jgi:2-keto-3-deoxy-L-rhamnonate aldolase RhmA